MKCYVEIMQSKKFTIFRANFHIFSDKVCMKLQKFYKLFDLRNFHAGEGIASKDQSGVHQLATKIYSQ